MSDWLISAARGLNGDQVSQRIGAEYIDGQNDPERISWENMRTEKRSGGIVPLQQSHFSACGSTLFPFERGKDFNFRKSVTECHCRPCVQQYWIWVRFRRYKRTPPELEVQNHND